MSYYHFSKELDRYKPTLEILMEDMIGNNVDAQIVLAKMFENMDTSLLLEKNDTGKLLYQKSVNFAIDHINQSNPTFLNKAETKITNYLDSKFNSEIASLSCKVNKTLIKELHFYKKNYSQIAERLNINKNDIYNFITKQNLILYKILFRNSNFYYEEKNTDDDIAIENIINANSEKEIAKIKSKYEKGILVTINSIVNDKTASLELANLSFEYFFQNLSSIPKYESISSNIYKIAVKYAIEFKNGNYSFEDKSNLEKIKSAINYVAKTKTNKQNKSEIWAITDEDKCKKVEHYYNSFTKLMIENLSYEYANFLEMKYLFKLSPIEICTLINQSIYYVRAQIIKAERIALEKIKAF